MLIYLYSLQFAHQSSAPPPSSLSNSLMTSTWKTCGDEYIISFLNNLLSTTTTSSNTNAVAGEVKGSDTSMPAISDIKKQNSMKMQSVSLSISMAAYQEQKQQWAHGMKVFDNQVYKVGSTHLNYILLLYTSIVYLYYILLLQVFANIHLLTCDIIAFLFIYLLIYIHS